MANLKAPSMRGTLRVDRFSYDFASDGGLQGAYGTNFLIPQNALVVSLSMLSIATLNSGGLATIDVVGASSGTSYLQGPQAFNAGSLPTIGLIYGDIVPAVTGTTSRNGTLATVSEQLNFVIAVADLTAGAFDMWVWYIIPSTM